MKRIARSAALERAAIVLAGGEGSRLSSLTRRITGQEVPKQFCTVLGNQTLLDQTLNRVSISVSPQLTSVVVTQIHERFYAPMISEAGPELVVQPQNRGTAPAILYPLLRLAEKAPQALVAIFPSDHFVSDDRGFMQRVESAFATVEARPELTVLLGVAAGGAETSYGWIEPAARIGDGPALAVRRFWEKPHAELAHELWRRGCLWNTLVVVGRVSTLLGLFMIALPKLYVTFKKIRTVLGTVFEGSTVAHLYRDIPSSSFSSDLLTRDAVNLAVLPVNGVHWSDLGEPDRVLATLERLGIQPRWMAA